jgi:heptosyltransferase-2
VAEARVALEELLVPRDAVLVGFHPGARWPTRRWAAENFVALAKRFLEREPRGVALVTAGPGEERTATLAVAALGDRARLIERWPLARFVAMQSLCRAFVCGDTGPVHSAAAAGTRTLGLMSRNRPAMFFPYPESAGHRAYYSHAECSPCHRDVCGDLRCLRALHPDGAWRLLETMLESPPGAPAGGRA